MVADAVGSRCLCGSAWPHLYILLDMSFVSFRDVFEWFLVPLVTPFVVLVVMQFVVLLVRLFIVLLVIPFAVILLMVICSPLRELICRSLKDLTYVYLLLILSYFLSDVTFSYLTYHLHFPFWCYTLYSSRSKVVCSSLTGFIWWLV